MKRVGEALYVGEVVHKRRNPIEHAFSYKVFSVLFDCSSLEDLDRRLRLFSYNRFNLLSLYDSDHGDGAPLPEYLAGIAARTSSGGEVERFLMLCYPRVLGYVFNPLTVYFGLDAQDRIRLVVYEVNNTFGERQTYVLPTEQSEADTIAQRCRKRLYVSPFNSDNGVYSFNVTPADEELTVGVALKDSTGPVLKAHFRGKRQTLTDANLLRALGRTGWMTVKVIAGIHYEAAKLWLKGLRLQPRPVPPEPPVTVLESPKEVFRP